MNFKRIGLAASAALALSLAASAGQAAALYDAVKDFSSSSASGVNGVWSYGWAKTGGTFNAFQNNSACFSGISCWQTQGMEIYEVPLVAKNTSGVTKQYGGPVNAPTVVHPVDVLNLHPGQTLSGPDEAIDAVVRFTALTSGDYRYNGFFEALDISPSGVVITAAGEPVLISGAATLSPLAPGGKTLFGDTVHLTAGQSLDFRVNRGGAIWNDSTGLSVQVQAVPEPATWGLMIMGFGAAGAALRSRRRVLARN